MKTKKVTDWNIAVIAGISAFLILALVACGGSAGNPLQDTGWELATLSGSDLLPGTKVTIEFAAGELSGTGGCNHYGGSYTSSGDSLSFSDIFSTEMACMEPAGILEQEAAYLAALGAADSYQMAGDRLEIFDTAGVQILVFVTPVTVGEEPTAQAVSEEPGAPVEAKPTESQPPESQESELTASIDVPASLSSGAIVMADFTLTNTSSDGLFVLKWFTPLEGIAGDIFRVERDGAELPYRGILVKRGAPLSEDFVWLEAGESVSVELDLAESYDFSQAGEYTIQFRSPQLSQVAKTETEKADSFEELGVIQIPSNTVKLIIESENAETPAASPVPEPLAGWKSYQDSATGVTVHIPESWVVTQILPNESAIFQSYPEDKYVGGEGRDPEDSKCDLTIRPPDVTFEGHMEGLRSSSTLTVVSEEELILHSGEAGIRVEVESMGPSVSMITEVNGRVVVLTCFGELAPFDEIAATLHGSPVAEFPADLKPYLDATAGVMVHMPEGWIATQIKPGEFAVLQSYPEDKYVGGEARELGDSKCDLTIRPAGIDLAGHMDELRSNPALNIISEDEILLRSGEPGFRVEVDSMGLSVSMITEVNGRVVVLACFGELARFDQMAATLAAAVP